MAVLAAMAFSFLVSERGDRGRVAARAETGISDPIMLAAPSLRPSRRLIVSRGFTDFDFMEMTPASRAHGVARNWMRKGKLVFGGAARLFQNCGDFDRPAEIHGRNGSKTRPLLSCNQVRENPEIGPRKPITANLSANNSELRHKRAERPAVRRSRSGRSSSSPIKRFLALGPPLCPLSTQTGQTRRRSPSGESRD
jgi:hypothetical protein